MADHFRDIFIILIRLIGLILLSDAVAVSFGEILTSNSGMAFVKECPKNLTAVQEASKKLNCDEDKYGNNRYICLPNTEKTSLLEFCHNGTMGMQDKGNCLEASNGSLHLQDCKHFPFGCPEMPFRSSEFYKYPACQTIDIKRQCYMLDTSCSSREVNFGVNTEELNSSIVVWKVLCCLSFIGFISSLLVIIYIKRRLKNYDSGTKTPLSTGQGKPTKTVREKPHSIFIVEGRTNGIEDSSTNSNKNHTYPLSRGVFVGTTFKHTYLTEKKDWFPEECHGWYSLRREDSTSDLLPAEKDVCN